MHSANASDTEDGYKSTKYRKPCIGAADGKVPGYGKALGTWIW